MKSLADLYDHMLRDVYHAEKQVLKQLPKLTRAVTDTDLKSLLEAEKAGVATRSRLWKPGSRRWTNDRAVSLARR